MMIVFLVSAELNLTIYVTGWLNLKEQKWICTKIKIPLIAKSIYMHLKY